MLALCGSGIGLRVAVGKALVLEQAQRDIPKYRIPKTQIESEINRYKSALDKAEIKLGNVRNDIADESIIKTKAFVDVHLLILKDPMIAEQPMQAIRDYLYNAEFSLQTQADQLAIRFQNIQDSYLRSKKDDVQQVVDRVLYELMADVNEQPTIEESDVLDHIVVTNDLMPPEVVTLHDRGIAAFVTSLGGPISHTAILARSLGIPAVVGLHGTIGYIQSGDVLAVDGHTGTVLVNPDQALLVEFQERQIKQVAQEQSLTTLQEKTSETRDGQVIDLCGNIELPEDIDALKRFGGDSVGLYRTEFLFMNRTDSPTEAEQYITYKGVLSGIAGSVTIRTLDLGADKQVDGGRTDGGAKVNPALGLRAIRLCLYEPNLFKPHLRAIFRASIHGRCRIMIPMLSSLSELDQTLGIIQEVKDDLSREGFEFDPNVPIGGMIEVPAAAIAADLFAKRLDFLSIGTNDLIQYTLAIDRIDDEVNYLYDPLHPSVLRLIYSVIHAGLDAGIPVSMCGEMAGDPSYTRLLIGLGLIEFSMAPSRLLEIKELVRKSNREKLMVQSQEILSCSTQTQARMIVERLNEKI